jgi:hypothetical protein
MHPIFNNPLQLQLLQDDALRSEMFALGLIESGLLHLVEEVAEIDI